MSKRARVTSVNDFYKVIKEDYLFTDKTLLVKEFIEGEELQLLLRPRRFGKSFNMSMLYYFLSPIVAGRETEGLFNGLKISQVDDGRFLRDHQGKYSVIFLDLKDIKSLSFASAIAGFKVSIESVYRAHVDLLKTKKLSPEQETLFKEYMTGRFSEELPSMTRSLSEEELAAIRAKLSSSIRYLSELLQVVYPEQKVVVLVDEYDTPLNFAYGTKHLDELTVFMKEFFGKSFKTNPYLYKGFMTGILRFSKNNMLSELNNLEVYSLFDQNYQNYYGLTLNEVNELFQACGLYDPEKTATIRAWYNGYQSGDLLVYNPWSIMSCLAKNGALRPYWVMTSNDDLLRTTMTGASVEIKDKFYTLLKGESVEGTVSAFVQFEHLTDDEKALWSLLLFAGYLKAPTFEHVGIEYRCRLQVPNEEVLCLYQTIFSNWLSEQAGSTITKALYSHLISGEIAEFETDVNEFLMKAASFRDYGAKPEAFYHGFMLALSAQIMETHILKSNAEGGQGLMDLLYIPKNGTQAIILEFKQTSHEKKLTSVSADALKQIKTRHYSSAIKQYDYIKTVLMVGMAFCGKKVSCKSEIVKIEKLK